MLELRNYQNESIIELREGFKLHQRQILCLPTGAGKTVVFSFIASQVVRKNKKVLILTDRQELFKQTFKSVNRLDLPVCKIDPDSKVVFKQANLFLGMVETFKRRIDLFQEMEFDLIICDECHKQAFNKVFDFFPKTMVLGCTATPVGKHLFKYYTNLVQGIDIPELIEQGFLSPCLGYEMQDDFSDLKTDKSGEFNEDSLFKHFNKSKLYEGLVDEYLKRANGKKTLIFNCSIEHTLLTTKAFNAAGIKSYAITSNTPKEEREYILESYDKGEFQVLQNANIFVAGYDNPSIEVIIMNRATTSLPVWLQAAGRGSRIFPGKNKFMLIDFGGNFSRHGLWDEPRTWSLKPPKKRNAKLGVKPVKMCVNCEAMIAAMARKCQFCGHEYAIGETVLKDGVLVEVKPKIPSELVERHIADLNIQELVNLQKTKLHTATMIWRVVRSKGEESVKEYAKLQGYTRGWIERQLLDMDNCKFNNYIVKQVMV